MSETTQIKILLALAFISILSVSVNSFLNTLHLIRLI